VQLETLKTYLAQHCAVMNGALPIGEGTTCGDPIRHTACAMPG
jgi:hypothetical protein